MTDSQAPGLLPDFRAAVICTVFSPLVVGTGGAAQSAVGWTTEESGLSARRRKYILILSKASEPSVRPTHLPVQR